MEYDRQTLIDNAILKAQDAILAAESNFKMDFILHAKIDCIMQFFML